MSSLHVALRKNKFYALADIDMWCDRYNFLPSSAASVNLQATLCAIIHRWFSFPDTSFFIFLVAVDVQWHFRLPVQPPCMSVDICMRFETCYMQFFYRCSFALVYLNFIANFIYMYIHARARARVHTHTQNKTINSQIANIIFLDLLL